MAEKKKKTAASSKSGGTRKKPAKKSAAARAKSAKTPVRSVPKTEPSVMRTLAPVILILLGVFLFLSLILSDKMGLFGKFVKDLFFGLFGRAGYLIPLLLILAGGFWNVDLKHCTRHRKLIAGPLLVLFTDALLTLWKYPANPHTFSAASLWEAGKSSLGGGVIGGWFGEGMFRLFSTVGTPIVSLLGILLCSLLLFNITPYLLYTRIASKVKRFREEEALRREELERQEAARQGVYRFTRSSESAPAKKARKVPAAQKTPERKETVKPLFKKHKRRLRLLEDTDEEPVKTAVPEKTPAAEESAAGNPSALSPAIPITVYGKQNPVPEPEEEPDDEPIADEPDRPADEPVTEQIPPLHIRKRRPAPEQEDSVPFSDDSDDEPEIPVEDGSDDDPMKSLGQILSDEVLANFEAEQRKKYEKPFTDDEEILSGEGPDESEFALAIERLSAMEGIAKVPEAAEEEEEEPKPEYVFPPISLLCPDTSPKNLDVSEELNSNAEKLVETLRSFKVRTRIVAISRGPTITRYELVPEEGVRVRAIANLVDDISLNLATSGVRIEAPIPGKSAVGIEVPNKNVSTVFLRDLVDTPKFRSAPSLLTTSLGMDVAGDPVYLDIAKMPHLLIAGATGMGKSVCINSLIVSLLYKGNPDQVKLIMIDPKKVELNIYNGLPHLLIPVVSDPKKAAGALHWAVSEMERRFELIEFMGVRDLKNYNKAIEGDPTKEFLPQIVIIIDELADLMMTAPDEVESSICRLAQKARAAGMHIIIGTQRPSTDVITGLIKANIPSRIAFTVSSQVDSRVVLDMAGAEKLIGRGDMLYAPVGATKPIRVQGAFVSEGEVESIVTFIKNQGEGVYDNGVIDSIEREAARCGNKKAGTFGDNPMADEPTDENDPMLKPAIELAVDAGKISTSLIQRKLSLGYGRAAKLIDRMEKMGIVSAPEGTKPRNVLITKEQYMEMVVSSDET